MKLGLPSEIKLTAKSILSSRGMFGNMFGVKDPISGWLRSQVYKFASAGCNARYVGETVRHFSTRVKEQLASYRASDIFKHLQNSEDCRALCSANCFHVLDYALVFNF